MNLARQARAVMQCFGSLDNLEEIQNFWSLFWVACERKKERCFEISDSFFIIKNYQEFLTNFLSHYKCETFVGVVWGEVGWGGFVCLKSDRRNLISSMKFLIPLSVFFSTIPTRAEKWGGMHWQNSGDESQSNKAPDFVFTPLTTMI